MTVELDRLLLQVEVTAKWLEGYCCSYKGPHYGRTLTLLLADYRRTLDGHGTQDPVGTA